MFWKFETGIANKHKNEVYEVYIGTGIAILYLFQALVDGKYMKIWHPPPLDTASGAVAARSVAAWRSILR